MTLLDHFAVSFEHEERRVELYHGDILEAPPADDADSVLVVSAFPNDYAPITGTVIGELAKRGVSVAALAEKKGHDFRDTAYAWVSGRASSWETGYPRLATGVPFRRVLCFEPPRGVEDDDKADWIVDGVFRALLASMNGEPTEVTMPLVATGNRGVPIDAVLPLLLNSAVHWMSTRIPLRRIRIFERDAQKARAARNVFAAWKTAHQKNGRNSLAATPIHDVFLSYCQKNAVDADAFVATLRALSPPCRVFRDVERLKPGMLYQKVLDKAMYESKIVTLLYTPEFFASRACLDELNVAFGRGLNENWRHVFPLLVRSAPLTDSAQRLQYVDCREADAVKLEAAAKELLARVADVR